MPSTSSRSAAWCAARTWACWSRRWHALGRPDVRLIVVGDGPEQAPLEARRGRARHRRPRPVPRLRPRGGQVPAAGRLRHLRPPLAARGVRPRLPRGHALRPAGAGREAGRPGGLSRGGRHRLFARPRGPRGPDAGRSAASPPTPSCGRAWAGTTASARATSQAGHRPPGTPACSTGCATAPHSRLRAAA